MYPLNLGSSFVVQQLLSSGAEFTGADFGRGVVTLGTSNAAITFRTKKYGAFGPYTVQIITGTGVPSTTVTLSGYAVVIRPSLNATAAQVSATVNALSPFPLRAMYGGTGASAVASASATSLTGGLDPTAQNGRFEWVRSGSGNPGGLFQFENDGPNDVALVRQAEFSFPGLGSTVDLVASVVNLDEGLGVISGTEVAFLRTSVNSSLPDYFIADINMLLSPRQAIKVVCAASGLVRFTARREARYPYQ